MVITKNNGFTLTPIHRCDLRERGGFIALISVIVITMILLGVTASLGMKGFLDRFNILEGEAKETSAGLAWACAQSARIKISADLAYQPAVGGDEFVVSTDPTNPSEYLKCKIVSVPTPGTTVCVQGVYRGATTNYRVELDNAQNVTELKEVTIQPDCI